MRGYEKELMSIILKNQSIEEEGGTPFFSSLFKFVKCHRIDKFLANLFHDLVVTILDAKGNKLCLILILIILVVIE